VLAQRATAGAGEAVPFAKHKTAFFAHRGDNLKTPPGARGPGEVGQVVQHLFFRLRQQLRQLQAGVRLLRQQFFHGLAHGAHRGIAPGDFEAPVGK
jgi:hypothetical protein